MADWGGMTYTDPLLPWAGAGCSLLCEQVGAGEHTGEEGPSLGPQKPGNSEAINQDGTQRASSP